MQIACFNKHTYIMSQNRRRNNDIFISIYTQAYNFTTSLRNKDIIIKISENVESASLGEIPGNINVGNKDINDDTIVQYNQTDDIIGHFNLEQSSTTLRCPTSKRTTRIFLIYS